MDTVANTPTGEFATGSETKKPLPLPQGNVKKVTVTPVEKAPIKEQARVQEEAQLNTRTPVEMKPATPIMPIEKVEIEKPAAVKAADQSNPIREVIAQDMFDLYGEIKEFTYELKNEQYNILLTQTGETFSLTKGYIDAEVAKKK